MTNVTATHTINPVELLINDINAGFKIRKKLGERLELDPKWMLKCELE